MTGKLIKYEIKSSIRLMALIWAALVATSILFMLSSILVANTTGIAITSFMPDSMKTALNVLTLLLYFLAFAAMVVITVVVVVMRFYKGLFSDEGYLMNTLPVKSWQLITAKGVAACILVLAGMVIFILSLCIIGTMDIFSSFPDLANAAAEIIKKYPQGILFFAEIIIVLAAGILKSVYQVYASIAIGQLVNRYRLLLALGAYVGISIVVSTIASAVMVIMSVTASGQWVIYSLLDGLGGNMIYPHLMLAVAFVITAMQLVAFHIVTERIMTLKLNLQ